jgi:hypothetical protein
VVSHSALATSAESEGEAGLRKIALGLLRLDLRREVVGSGRTPDLFSGGCEVGLRGLARRGARTTPVADAARENSSAGCQFCGRPFDALSE